MKTECETVASNDVPTDFMQNKSSQGKICETTKQTNKQTPSSNRKQWPTATETVNKSGMFLKYLQKDKKYCCF